MTFTCDDKETLIAYLYGEIDAPTSRAVQEHLARCESCAREVSALSDVRSELGAWAAPEANLDFAIVRKSALPATVLRPARWWNVVPAWAQAAAAMLVLAAGASVANLQITSGPNGVSVSTGWMRAANAADTTRAAAGPAASSEEWKTALTSLEQQLRQEIRASRDQAVPVPARAGAAADATMRRVQQLIGEAEQRHSRELAQRLVEFQRDVTMQRRADLMQISNSLSNSFGAYDRQLLQQRQLLNNVMRVSTTPQQ